MPDDNKKRANAGAVYQALTLGLVFPLCIGLGYAAGYGLDRVFGTRPWMAIIFTVLGIAAAFVQLFRAGKASDGG